MHLPADTITTVASAPAEATVVQMEGIAKRFDSVKALRGVDFDVAPGEVHALVGENGAGKSTLIKILAGIHRADAGRVLVGGEEVHMHGPADARRAGINFVFQELAPLPHFTVAEYMSLGQAHARRFGVLVDWRAMRRRAKAIADRFGLDFHLNSQMRDLSVAQQRMAEIGQALMHDARLVVMDEPTATLSDRETESLFRVIRELRSEGVAVVYVSHRLEEIFALADRVTVFRDGARIATHAIGDCTREQLVLEIIGAKQLVPRAQTDREVGEVVLETRGLTTATVRDVSLQLRRGEIVGLAGLVGSGRTEVARALFGLDRVKAGELLVAGRPVRLRGPRDAIGRGIGLLPEERKTEGLVTPMCVRENITIGALRKYARPSWGLLSKRRERAAARAYGASLQVKFAGPDAPITSLSGGNQQKVVLARIIDMGARILLLDEPTKGVDIGAKREMFALIRELAADGAAVLYISSEHEELAELCDRAVVMREGAVVAELDCERLDKSSILELSYGRREQ